MAHVSVRLCKNVKLSDSDLLKQVLLTHTHTHSFYFVLQMIPINFNYVNAILENVSIIVFENDFVYNHLHIITLYINIQLFRDDLVAI